MSKRKEFHVARELRVRLSEKGDWLGSVSRSSGEFFLAGELLLLLQEVQRSRVIDAALATRLRRTLETLSKGSPDAVEIDGLVEELHGAGLLVSEGGRARKDALLRDGFGDPWIQWAMLADAQRCNAYEAALTRAVDDRSVLVDVGAGTGLLGAMALRAGAKKVFAIEETAAAQGISTLFKELGLPHSKPAYELFQGNSAEAPLPSSTTHIVSELFGNDPFCEGVLPTLRDIGARLPAKAVTSGNIKWIPESLETFVEICTLKGSPVYERVRHLAEARHAGGNVAPHADFHAAFLATAAAHMPHQALSFAVFLQPGDLERQGEPCSLGSIRLDPPSSPVVRYAGEKPLRFEVPAQGPHPLIALVWFRVKLDSKTTLSNHPHEPDACGHWSPLVVPLAPEAWRPSQASRSGKDQRILTARFGISAFEDYLHVELLDPSGRSLGSR